MVEAGGTGTPGVSERIEGMGSPFSRGAAMDVIIEIEPPDTGATRWVIDQAQAELLARYGFVADYERGLSTSDFDPPAGAYVIARPSGVDQPVGGVGVRCLTDTVGEVKRLWVARQERRMSIARALMAALERASTDLGLQELRLETGAGQPEAVALYAGSGWVRQKEHWAGGPIPVGSIHFAKDVA
jgi:GNAT superfamily N-acetyltransferase